MRTGKKQVQCMLAALVVLALLAFPSMAGAENGWISGVVKDGSPGGPGLAAVTVSLVNTSWSTTTDAGGKYNISVPAGNYTVKASVTNYADSLSEVMHVSPNETTALDTFLEKLKGSISGRITDTDDGKAIPGVAISLEGTSYTSTTDEDGRYDIQGIDVGSYKWILRPPRPYDEVNSTTTVKAGQNIIKDYKLKAPTKFTFMVKGSGGAPLLGATVTAKNNQAGLSYTATTDSDGLATLDVLPNTYVVTIEADGYKAFITTYTIAKGDNTAPPPITLSKVSDGGGGGGLPVALIGGAAAFIVAVLVIVAVLLLRKKKLSTGGPGATPGTPGAPAESAEPGAPPGQKTQAQKMKGWADFERMYGRPHPEAPGWVSAGAAAAAAPKPKCPRDGSTVTFEPFSGQYFCSKCDQRYKAEEVFRKEDEVLEQSRPADAPRTAPGTGEPEERPAGEKLELSAAQPTWALEHGQTMTGEDYAAPGGAAPPAPPPASPSGAAPQAAAPMEAAPVSDDEPAADAAPAAMPEGVNPEAGPIFNMPKPIDYTDLPPPPPPKEPPKQTE